MKKIVLILVVVFFFQSILFSQLNAVDSTDVGELVITKAGQPAGEGVSQKIGKEGGKIISADGKVELIFPEGALDKKTNISIQPVSNTMPGSRGKAYHLQPAGIVFKKPVEIIFHYKSHELNGNSPELLGIAMQDEKGQWYGLKNFTLDTINRALKGQIRHFSYWVDYFAASISPASGRLKVNKELLLQINSFRSNNDEELTPLSLIRATVRPIWTANGVTNGNSHTGTITTQNQLQWVSLYKAPASVPDRNPVAVTAEIKNLSFKIGNQSYTNLKLTSNILIYDNAFEVIMEGWNDNTAEGMCTMRLIDEGSFVVQLDGNRTTVMDVQNNLYNQPVKAGCPCSFTWINQAACLGPIHIGAVQSIYVVPANPPSQPYSQVKIMFVPGMTPMPIFYYVCPKKTGTTPLFSAPTFPRYLEFYTKNEEQVIMEEPNPSHGFRIKVRPIRDD
jgi:hypothetical protein